MARRSRQIGQQDIQPGEFHRGENQEIEKDPYFQEDDNFLHTLETSDSEILAYQAMIKELQPLGFEEWCILYPSCATDVSPSVVFHKNEVVYVDIRHSIIATLIYYGYVAYEISVLDFQPKHEVGLLILLNPALGGKKNQLKVAHIVRLGGFVFCNNYHKTASDLNTDNDFRLIAGVRIDTDKKLQIQKVRYICTTDKIDFRSLRLRRCDYFIFQRMA